MTGTWSDRNLFIKAKDYRYFRNPQGPASAVLHIPPAAQTDYPVLWNIIRLYLPPVLLKRTEYSHTIHAYMGILKNVRNYNKYFAENKLHLITYNFRRIHFLYIFPRHT
jgi:hypothetical protein